MKHALVLQPFCGRIIFHSVDNTTFCLCIQLLMNVCVVSFLPILNSATVNMYKVLCEHIF